MHSLGTPALFSDARSAEHLFRDKLLWRRLVKLEQRHGRAGDDERVERKNAIRESAASEASRCAKLLAPPQVVFRFNREEKLTDRLLQQLETLLASKERYGVYGFACRRCQFSFDSNHSTTDSTESTAGPETADLYMIELVFSLSTTTTTS